MHYIQVSVVGSWYNLLCYVPSLLFLLGSLMFNCKLTVNSICDWICKKGSYTCNYKYLEISF